MTGPRGYLRAREHLRRDFGYRCAYCMIHEQQAGGNESFWIDHFRPRSKGGPVNDYANLYWSCIGCNHIKGDAWPTPSERRLGWRLADPCAEQDYGVHFVENEEGYLVPRTRCGEYHLLRLRLNRESRVRRRLERNELRARLEEAAAHLRDLAHQAVTAPERAAIARILELLEDQLAVAIPFIPLQAISAEQE